jgi:hypothetical protein
MQLPDHPVLFVTVKALPKCSLIEKQVLFHTGRREVQDEEGEVEVQLQEPVLHRCKLKLPKVGASTLTGLYQPNLPGITPRCPASLLTFKMVLCSVQFYLVKGTVNFYFRHHPGRANRIFQTNHLSSHNYQRPSCLAAFYPHASFINQRHYPSVCIHYAQSRDNR